MKIIVLCFLAVINAYLAVDLKDIPLSDDEKCDVYLLIEASVLYDKIDFSMDIINEIISSTNFNMKERIKECLAMEQSVLQQALVGSGHSKSMTRALSYNEEKEESIISSSPSW